MAELNHSDIILTNLLSLIEQIGSMDTKLDSLDLKLMEHLRVDETLHNTQNDKIQKIHDSQKRIKWVATGAALAISAFWKVVSVFLLRHTGR